MFPKPSCQKKTLNLLYFFIKLYIVFLFIYSLALNLYLLTALKTFLIIFIMIFRIGLHILLLEVVII